MLSNAKQLRSCSNFCLLSYWKHKSLGGGGRKVLAAHFQSPKSTTREKKYSYSSFS